MNELIAKLQLQVSEIGDRQTAALTAAESNGVTADAKAGHLAEFDRLQVEKEGAQASLNRALKLNADREQARTPVVQPIVLDRANPIDPNNANRGQGSPQKIKIPARPKGELKAFRGDEQSAARAGLWCAAAIYGSQSARRECERLGIGLHSYDASSEPSATLFTTRDSSGGFFVPIEFSNAVIEITQEYGVFRKHADVETMVEGTKTVPRWNGAMTAFWVGEGQAPNEVDPTWDLVTLIAKNLAALTKMSRQLEEDSAVDLGEKIAKAVGLAFAYAEDQAGFLGDGTSAYGGITGVIQKLAQTAPINNSASLISAPSGATTIQTLTLKDYQAVIGASPEYPGWEPKWFCHKNVFAQSMMALQTAVIGTRPSDIRGNFPKEFLGYEVVISQVLPSSPAANTVAVLFGDLRMSAKLGDRRMMAIESGFINDDFTRQLISILATNRMDINVHTLVDPKTPTIAGPMMGLELQ